MISRTLRWAFSSSCKELVAFFARLQDHKQKELLGFWREGLEDAPEGFDLQ